MSLTRLCGLVLFFFLFGEASAQRAPVPLSNFKDIPIATASTPARAKAAIVRAILIQSWEVVQEADGSLLASTIKGGDHHIKVRITYDATKYSLVYVDSKELMASAVSHPDQTDERRLNEAAERQLKLYKYEPSTPYAVSSDWVIHPFYNLWVRELLAGIRRQLMAPEV